MIRYYLAPYIGSGASPRDAFRPAFFWDKSIPDFPRWDADRDEETKYFLVATDLEEPEHLAVMATEGMIYIGTPGEIVGSRPQIIAAGYPVDPGESVDQVVVELQNQMWVAMARTRYHVRLRAIGLDPSTRPTKAQEVAAARAGFVNRPQLREFPVVTEARMRKQ